MEREEIEQQLNSRKRHVNKNLLAILLIIAILISLLGTYMTISNINNAPVERESISNVGYVGIYVDNPDIPEEVEDEGST